MQHGENALVNCENAVVNSENALVNAYIAAFSVHISGHSHTDRAFLYRQTRAAYPHDSNLESWGYTARVFLYENARSVWSVRKYVD